MYDRVVMVKILLTIALSLFLLVFPHTASADNTIVINEVMVDPVSGNEWVEFYIPENTSIEQYWIDDDIEFDSDGGSKIKQITDADVNDTGYYVYETSGVFNNSGDTVVLFDSEGAIVDQFVYEENPGKGVTFGRSPDRTGSFALLDSATKGYENSTPKPTSTPIPTPTEKPSSTPKPSKTPVPTKESKSTKEKVLDDVKEVLSKTTSLASKAATKRVASNGAYPTAILRERKPTPTPEEKQILVAGESDTTIPHLAFLIGGVLTMACGILVYHKKRKASL